MTTIDRCLTCTLQVYERDMVTPRGDPLSGKGITTVDDFGLEGGAQASASWWEAAVLANPGLFRDAVVKVSTDFGAGEVAFAAFLSEIGSGTLIGEGELAAQDVTPAGRGLLGYFSDWKLAHEKGWLPKDYSQDNQRYFGPMSGFFDDSGWSTPLTMRWYDDPSARAGFPAQMLDLDKDAEWIGVTDPVTDSVPKGTINWFRKQVTLAVETSVALWATADNYARVWLDSELIYDLTDDLYNWKGLTDPPWSAILPAGTYTIAARVENAALTSGSNPIGFLATFWSLDSSGNPDTLLTHTDDSWTCFDATDDPAGLTVGQTILQVMSEATDRGLPSMARLNPTFTETHDTDGVAFLVDEERSAEVGTDGLDFLKQLGETSCDIDLLPNGDLNVYVKQGTDRSADVILTEGVQITSDTYEGTPRTGTRVIVKTSETTVVVISDEFEADFDAREDYTQSDTATTRAQGIKVAVRWLQDSTRDRIVYTLDFVALAGCTPYVDFGKGDTITALDLNKDPAPFVVTSITGKYPDAGGVWTWTLELEEPEDVAS